MRFSLKRFLLFALFLVSALYRLPICSAQTTDSLSSSQTSTLDQSAESRELDFIDVVPPILENRKTVKHPWIFIVAVLSLLLIGLIRAIAMQQHSLSLRSAFTNISNQFEQIDKEATVSPVVILQVFVSSIIIALGLFVIQPFSFSIDFKSDFTYFLILLLAICLVYTIKYGIHFLVGVVLQTDNLARLTVIGMSSMLYAFTLLIFPLIITWYYVPVSAIKVAISTILLVLLVVFVIWRLVKCATIYYRYFPFAKIYIIIYLCALEMTPILIIGKLISSGV